MRDPARVHAMCEDYRAAATIDLEHDRADREAGRRLALPLRVLWGEHGVVARCFEPLALWQEVATDVSGRALPCGHYIPEEAPEPLLEEMLGFFR
jgi:haloacetate dehalogenase